MKLFSTYIGDLFIHARFYWVTSVCVVLFIISFYYPPLLIVPKTLFYLILSLTAIDYVFLFFRVPAPLPKESWQTVSAMEMTIK